METVTKSFLEQQIEQLPAEKRQQIADKIHEASLLINSVEVDLQGTLLQVNSLLDGKEHYSLWGQLYKLYKLFKIEEEENN